MELYSWIAATGVALSFGPGLPSLPEAPCLCAPHTAIAWPAALPAGAVRVPVEPAAPRDSIRPKVRPVASQPPADGIHPDVAAAPLPFPSPVFAPNPSRALPYPSPEVEGARRDPPASPPELQPAIVPDLRLQAYGSADFIVERAQIISALAAEPSAKTRLELASLHLAHGLSAEALSHLADVDPPSREERLRQRALRLLAGAFAGEETRAEDDVPPDWPLLPLVSLLAAPQGEHPDAMVIAAAASLDDLPERLRAQALPELLAQTVSRELWHEAHALAQRFADHPEIADGSAFHFLLGQVAEAGGEDVAAFDSYRHAAQGRDRWAQRARLALVSLGQRTATVTEAEAAELLTEAASLWRGDDTGRATREALAEARIAAGDRAGAVTALAEVFRAHPNSIAAQKARPRVADLLSEIYTAGTAGDLPLTQFIEVHRALSVDLRFEPEFHAQAERLAEHLLALGLTAAAAEEFGKLADLVAVAAEVDPARDDPARRDRLRLRQAEALFAGGQIAPAASLLSEGPGALEDDLRERFITLRAEVLGAPEDNHGLHAAGPNPRLLRLKADALFDTGQWRRASEFYERYQNATDGIPPALGPRMALAAHRAGRPDRVQTVLAAMPKVKDTPVWAEIAREIASPAERVPLLRRDAVQRQIESAAQVADRSGRLRAAAPEDPEL